ncbi:uncharacterized protein LOC141910343 [Tubulanus polymorphus]|uniref:uncharacterized protein LOC141910343 n=1 Tax=Tubulanus polymorphus TaxID=672921 RepID=UPI003DA587AC
MAPDDDDGDERPLMDKFNETYATKKRLIPQLFNYFAMPWYIFTVTASTYIGLTECLPIIYADFEPWVLTVNQCVAVLFLLEMTVNFVCIRQVEADYTAEVYEKWKHLRFGGTIHESAQEDLTSYPKSMSTNGCSRKTVNNNLPGPVYRLPLNGSADVKTTEMISKTKGPTHTVAVSEIDPSGRKIFKLYPYWSWKTCLICQIERPPRVFHCPLCNKCTLKRDHHCFFTRCCVGLRNQRHFIVFAFWSALTTAYVSVHATIYLFVELLPKYSCVDLFLPATVVRWLLGFTSFRILTLCMIFYSVLWFCPLSAFFFYEQMALVRRGTTSFEEDNRIKVPNAHSFRSNLRGTFGRNWLLNFIVPCHFMFPCEDNGITWASMSATSSGQSSNHANGMKS